MLTFPVNGNPTGWVLTAAQVAAWGTQFPGVDVLAEARQALAWIEANPARRKTARGMPRFLVSWLLRASQRPRPTSRGVAPASDTRRTLNRPGRFEPCLHVPRCRSWDEHDDKR